MKVYALLLLIVGCCGLQWKALNDFKGNFKKYVILSLNTTSSIRNILDVSRLNAEYFINNTYSNNKLVKRITKMRTSNDKCFTGIVDEKTLKAFFANRIDKFQIPLRRRFLLIKQILNKIISLMDNYERFARRIFRVCNPLIKNCLKETNEWLKSTLNSLSCAIRPKCQVNNNVTNHLIRKRASCTTRQFSCKYGKCISSKMFCNGICDCADCSDEPPDCRRHCSEFRCGENFHCISYDKKCNGIDDCGDGTDEVGCQQISITRPPYRGRNCSIVEGKFLCRNMKCIELQRVCDGHNTCGDWSDEGVHCKVGQCSPRCGRLGGVCISRPKGSECVIECPPGTYETSKGCNLKPEAPLTSLVQILEDTPRLKKRYIARLKFLKKNTIKMIYKSLVDILKCKKRRFSILSAIVRMSNRTINYRSLNNHTDIEETEDLKTNKETPETKTNTTTLETTPNTAISMLHGNENLTISPQILNNSPQHTRRGRNRKTKKKEKMEKHEKHLDEDVTEIDFSHASEYEENDKVTNDPTTASTDNTTPSPSNTVSDKPDRTTVEKITAGANSYVTEADGRNETNTTDLETTLNTTTSILHVNKSSETTSKNTIPMTFISSKPGGHENNKAENFNFDGGSHGNNKTKEEADTIKTNETTKEPSKRENQGSATIDDFDSGMKSNRITEIKKEPTITPINETTPETSSNSTIPGVVKPENQGIKAGNDAYTDGRIGEDYDSEKKKKNEFKKNKRAKE